MIEPLNIPQRVRSLVLAKAPDAQVYLYGSRAKGTSHLNSDWDFLILLNSSNLTLELERAIAYPLYDLEFETGEVISPIIYTKKDWSQAANFNGFLRNIADYQIAL